MKNEAGEFWSTVRSGNLMDRSLAELKQLLEIAENLETDPNTSETTKRGYLITVIQNLKVAIEEKQCQKFRQAYENWGQSKKESHK